MTLTDDITLTRSGGAVRVETGAYALILAGTRTAPYALLTDASGTEWSELSLLSSVHTVENPDEVWAVNDLAVTETARGDILITVSLSSTAWQRHETRLLCTPRGIEVSVSVTGAARITDVTVLGGRAVLSSGAAGEFRSSVGRFAGVLVPAATEPIQLVRPSRSAATLGVVGDADPGRLNAVFSPPPLALGLSRKPPVDATGLPDGDWLGLWLRAPVRDLTFTAMRYLPLDSGFLLQLDYEGHTRVDGTWTSPTVVIRPADTGWQVLEDYRADLVDAGAAPASGPEVEPWWREPIFCGWGAQCARSMHLLHAGAAEPTSDTVPQSDAEESLITRAASSFSRADVYDDFLARLAESQLVPGTIVLDDRWQSEYGTATVDTDHWPDLKGWIAERHAAGQRVLLWWKAWDPEGIPASECITTPDGRPVSVDPANQRYQARLRTIVSELLSPEGLDADGFKIDFTQRSPSGRFLNGAEGSWGIAGLHLLLSTLHDAAKLAKPDSLVITHTMHPSFADVTDMIRLNDVSKRDITGARVPVVDQLTFRHAIARRVLPLHPIDTDQWPMPNRAEWLRYAAAQVHLGVPALYYVEAIDRSGESIDRGDLAVVADTWRRYRESLRP